MAKDLRAAEILEELLPPNFMGEITPDGPRETDINKRKRREALKQLHDEVIERLPEKRNVEEVENGSELIRKLSGWERTLKAQKAGYNQALADVKQTIDSFFGVKS